MDSTTGRTPVHRSTPAKTTWRQQWIGLWIIGVAIIHTGYGAIFFGTIFVDIIRRGIINTVGVDPMVGAAVWFLMFGFVLGLLGGAVASLQRSEAPLPASVGWGLLAVVVAGVLLMPASGFWLAFPPAIGLLIKKRPSVRG